MFGYVVPLRGELKVRELDAYQSVYCGLCHALGRRYGFLPRLLLSYDFAFLAMVLAGPEGSVALERRRCVACPVRGKRVCPARPELDTAADASVILTYWKLRDSVADRSFFRGLPARLLSILLRPAYRKAARLRPDFDRQTVSCLEELRTLEEDESPSLDRTADTFARILAGAAPDTGDTVRDRALGQLLYHVGRWIYLVDAWDDLEEDKRRGGYNPIATRFPSQEKENRKYLRTTLRHSLNLARSAGALLELGYWQGTVENILYLGLPAVEELVFSGRWKTANHRNRRQRT